MSRFNHRVGFQIGRRTVVILSCALVIVLISTNLLMYYNVFTPVQLSGAGDIRIPSVAATPVPATEPPAGPHTVDKNYKRAVTSQLAQISEEDSLPGPTLTPVFEKPPTPGPKMPARQVTLSVNTVDAPLNVRARPGTSAPVIGSLAPGTPLTAIAINAEGSWILAHIPNLGEPGWVFAGLVRVTSGDLSTLRQVDPEPETE